MNERWKEIKGNAGYYISDLGSVKKAVAGGGFIPVSIYIQRAKGRKPICKFYIPTKRYVQQFYLHRIVAQYFCKGHGRFVGHKDGDTLNNVYSNLYFTDKMPYPREVDHKRREVEQYSLAGIFVKRYSSITEASLKTGIRISCICEACRGKTKKGGGYKWKYVESK